MLYVIKLGFEMINTKFFRVVDENALMLLKSPITAKALKRILPSLPPMPKIFSFWLS